VLRALRRAHPGMRIDVLTSAEGRAVLSSNPHVHAVHVLRARRPPRELNPWRVALERRLAASAYDAVVLLEGAERYRDLAARSGATVWTWARDGRTPGPREAVRGSHHELFNFFAVLERMGIAPAGVHYDFPIGAPARARADALLELHGAGTGVRIGVHPGFHQRRTRLPTRVSAKAWPLGRWAAVIERLSRARERAIVLTGTRRERERNRAIAARAAAARTIDIAGETDLEVLAAVISRCDVFISPDTGPAHLAAAVDTPLVALFGPKAPHIMGPLGDERRIIRLYPDPSDASPQERQGHHPRMWAITVGDVVAPAERMLAVHTGPGAEAAEGTSDSRRVEPDSVDVPDLAGPGT
ncbi:MAG: glycosyltransferase family 9 protein, partial [Gemmatimonadetes bacterium]|nr:glycosyltransferase family 9 protein [Gemmatimonadota bacterium]